MICDLLLTVSGDTVASNVTGHGRQEGSLVQQNSVVDVSSNFRNLTSIVYFRHNLAQHSFMKFFLVIINLISCVQQNLLA